ncbi:MAG: metallopeptidase TldD-related protein [Actinomycetota bacterium]|nr:metallopeptidase TldD-related protein [Actinomycetota bacterium]
MIPQEIVERTLQLSRADGCVVLARENSSANLRWAGNTLTTNGLTNSRSLTVISTVAGATGVSAGVVSRSSVPLDRLEDLVRASEAAARSNGPAEDAMPLVEPTGDDPGWEEPAQRTTIAVFRDIAPALGAAFGQARDAGHLLYGYAEHETESVFLGTSTGLRRRHDQPAGRVELTGRFPDGSRSAWAGQAIGTGSDADVAALAADVERRLSWAERRVELPAGRYDTVLPASAVADLMLYMYWSSSDLDAHEGRTVFSRNGGGTRVGEQLSRVPLRLRSDPAIAGMAVAPFVTATASSRMSSVFDNGIPLGPTDWISDGKLTALISTRHTANITGLPVTPWIDNLEMSVGDNRPTPAIEELIAGTDRGLLLTCLWYIREVDPQTLLLTGLTRDGVFFIENGEVTAAVNNFRFNESPVDLLGRMTDVGPTGPTLPREFGDYFRSAAMPPARVADFHMSSVSQAS